MADAASAGLVLASASRFRRKLLEAAGVPFRVVPARVDEAALKSDLVPKVGPGELAKALAAAKAEAVSRELPGSLVVGADQVLVLDDAVLDKPRDLAAAREQLQRLRGRTHMLLSAVALAEDGRVAWTMVEEATLTMRDFSGEFLDEYLSQCGATVCEIVGAYEIEGFGIQLFERVEGDHFTIIGLPLLPLLAELRARGMVQT